MSETACDICHQRARLVVGAEQPICATCLRACRARAGIHVEPAAPIPSDLVPFASHVEHGPVPMRPTRAQVELASLAAADGTQASCWNLAEHKRRFVGAQ